MGIGVQGEACGEVTQHAIYEQLNSTTKRRIGQLPLELAD